MIELKLRRLGKGLTQKDVASRVGISTSFYNEIENGKRKPSVENAKKIAQVLGVDWTLLFD